MFTSNRRVLHCPAMMLGLLLVASCGGAPPAQSPEHGAEASAEPAVAPSAGKEASTSGGAPSEKTEVESHTAATDEFKTADTHTAKETHGVEATKLVPTKTEALLKLVVIDKDKGPSKGIVVSLTGADGRKFFAAETDAVGYAEVLVPVGQKYEIVYLGLGHRDIAATTTVDDLPKLTMKLTLRFKGLAPGGSAKSETPRFVLDGVNFDTG
ncbi:MAG: hypothetical protein ACHREM_17730, partial [Polyangiales bacterium]